MNVARFGSTLLAALAVAGFVSCASTSKRPKQGGIPTKPTQPPPPSLKDKNPVFILPQLVTGWVNESGDETTYRGGYITASVVKPGYWATREEAELAGLPFITPDSSAAIVPTQPSARDGQQEINSTVVAQRLAEAGLGSPPTRTGSAPVDTSLGNQLPSPSVESQPPPPPPPLPTPEPAPVVTPTPTPAPTPVPTRTSSAPPKVGFSDKTNELLIYPGGTDGQTLSVSTPLGPAVLNYTGGKLRVTYQGRQVTIEQPKTEPARLHLSP
jgi:hypothetical protein